MQVSLRVSGDIARLRVEGAAQLAKAALVCPWTRYPVSNLSATVRLADNALKVRPLTLIPRVWWHATTCGLDSPGSMRPYIINFATQKLLCWAAALA